MINMTKTIILGEQKDGNTPIEFITFLTKDFEIEGVEFLLKPSSYNFIECICKRYDGDLDLMFAYNDAARREQGTLFIGKWNNGIVK